MKIYFDENFSIHFIRGLKIIQESQRSEGFEVLSIKEEFGAGAPDEEWIPKVAQQHGVVITQDTNIHRLNHQWELCQHYRLGLFFVQPPKKGWNYWTIVQLLIKLWQEIKAATKAAKKPFGYKITVTKPKLDKLSD